MCGKRGTQENPPGGDNALKKRETKKLLRMIGVSPPFGLQNQYEN